MIPNFAMMSFVGYFFSGFVCLKMPFSLPSVHFKVKKRKKWAFLYYNFTQFTSLPKFLHILQF